MQPQYIAVHPHALYAHSTVGPHQSSLTTSDSDYLAQLEALLREHEPHKVRQARDLLRTYAGMERELLQCYRHHYTGDGGFRVASSSASRVATTAFSLPTTAIATYLREKLRARRSSGSLVPGSSNTTNNSSTRACPKGDDVRSPEMLLLPTTVQRSATATIHRNPRGSSSSSLASNSSNNNSNGCAVRPLPMLLCATSRQPQPATAVAVRRL